MKKILCVGIWAFSLLACKKKDSPAPAPPAGPFNHVLTQIPGNVSGNDYNNVPVRPVIKLSFSAQVSPASVKPNILLNESSGAAVARPAADSRKEVSVPSFAVAIDSRADVGSDPGHAERPVHV